jgi:hypothetical protein
MSTSPAITRRAELVDESYEHQAETPSDVTIASLVSEIASQTETLNASVAALAEEPARVPVAAADQSDGALTWHLRSAILDRLDDYFDCMRRLRKHDPDAYKFFSRVGFAIPPELFINGWGEAARESLAGIAERPAFGGVLFASDAESREGGHVYPSFIYFSKVSAPLSVERFCGDVYALKMLWDNRARGRARVAAPVQCHIGIAPDGAMTLLREVTVQTSRVQPNARKRGHRKPPPLTLRSMRFDFPSWVSMETNDPQKWTCGALAMALLTYASAVSRIVIRAKKDNCVAAFGIELATAKSFFADRSVTALARDGRKKRIFHAVTAHARRIREGKETQVKSHYRGIRSFDWNGYGIHIVLPRVSSAMVMPLAATYEADLTEDQRPQFMGEEAVAGVLEEVLAS